MEALQRRLRHFEQSKTSKILLSTYFGSVAEHAALLKSLPVDGLHIDLVRAPEQLDAFADYDKVLSAGVIDGRNIWRANLNKVLETVEPLQAKLGDRLWISSSCSLLHTPFDLSVEEKLKANKPDLVLLVGIHPAKTQELRVLKAALTKVVTSVAEELAASQAAATPVPTAAKSTVQTLPNAWPIACQRRPTQISICRPYQSATSMVEPASAADYQHRFFPTNYRNPPSTCSLQKRRAVCRRLRSCDEKEIALVVEEQEKLDLDVLVHGEAERNDMVEYFGELLSGSRSPNTAGCKATAHAALNHRSSSVT